MQTGARAWHDPGMTPAEMAFEDLTEELEIEHPDVVAGKLFSMPAWKVAGKAIGGRWDESLVFKLGPGAHGEALALDGAELFDPSGRGRHLKEWVVVPATHQDRWPEFARAALAYRAHY